MEEKTIELQINPNLTQEQKDNIISNLYDTVGMQMSKYGGTISYIAIAGGTVIFTYTAISAILATTLTATLVGGMVIGGILIVAGISALLTLWVTSYDIALGVEAGYLAGVETAKYTIDNSDIPEEDKKELKDQLDANVQELKDDPRFVTVTTPSNPFDFSSLFDGLSTLTKQLLPIGLIFLLIASEK